MTTSDHTRLVNECGKTQHNILLPWFERALHPNARVHHYVLAKKKSEARELAFALASDCTGFVEAPISVTILVTPPDKRRRDLLDCGSALKAALDGISDAIGVDDRFFYPFKLDWGDGEKGTILVILEQTINVTL